MKIYINNDFDDKDICNPNWIFKKLPCLTNYTHGIEHTSSIPYISIRPYIEINNVEQLFKLIDDINDISCNYKLVVEPFRQIGFYEHEMSYDEAD